MVRSSPFPSGPKETRNDLSFENILDAQFGFLLSSVASFMKLILSTCSHKYTEDDLSIERDAVLVLMHW